MKRRWTLVPSQPDAETLLCRECGVSPLLARLAARAAAYRDPVELKLVTTLWNPHKVLGSPDDRDLGVMVDRVAVR